MISELIDFLPKELNNIVFEYTIEPWLIKFTERYIEEYFGKDVYDILDIKKLSIKAIPNFESLISKFQIYNTNILPWEYCYDDTEAWYCLLKVVESVTSMNSACLYYIYIHRYILLEKKNMKQD